MRSTILLVTALLAGQWETGDGKESHSADDKIVGGSEVKDIREMPYIIAISIVKKNCTAGTNGKKKCKDVWNFICAGSLLNTNYVITACHCVVDFEEGSERMAPIPMKSSDGSILRLEEFRYVAGSRSIHQRDVTAQVRIPSELHHHPLCAQESDAAISDIGIAKMQKPFEINEFVQPVNLFSSERRKFQTEFDSMLQRNPHCQVSGWGSSMQEKIDRITNEHITSGMEQNIALILKTAKMNVLTQSVCLKKFAEWAKEDFEPIKLDFKKLDQICIWSPLEKEGFCSGDSGGPFVCNGYFIALVSNSMECGTSLPQVCQMVTTLFDWIRRDFCNKSDCSDMLYKAGPLENKIEATQQMSKRPNLRKARARSRRVHAVGGLTSIITVIVINLLIN